MTADRGDAGRRLDLVLRRRLTGVASASRTRVQAWIERGSVRVNGACVVRPSSRLAEGDVIAVALEGVAPRRTPQPENAALEVLYEDSELIAVNKPAGAIAHPTYKHPAGTLLNALLGRAREDSSGDRPALVGRLDRLTSGVIVAAKTPRAYAALHRAVAAGEKTYVAVVYGRVRPARGTIDLPLARDPHDRRRVVIAETVSRQGQSSDCGSVHGRPLLRARPSVTSFERLADVNLPAPNVSLVRCRLHTGRMHQIRVHLAARHWPIVGDPIYGEPQWLQVEDPRLREALRAFPRQALHAWRVAFIHPSTGARVTITAPLPADLVGLFELTGLSSDALATSD